MSQSQAKQPTGLERYSRRMRHGFTLTEIVIIIAIIGIIVAIAAPTWYRQREITRGISCQENLHKIDQAKEQYAMDFKALNDSTISYPSDLLNPAGQTVGYLKFEPLCPADGIYDPQKIGTDPTCSIGKNPPYEPHLMHPHYPTDYRN